MLKLREYQEVATDFLYEHDRGMMLASVGAGKTCCALTAMKDMLRDGHTKRWLVIAPKRVCTDVWPDEKDLWAPELSLEVAVGNVQKRKLAFSSGSQIVVTNYDSILGLSDLSDFDGIVFDELTRLKNPAGKRFKHLYKLIQHINIRWGLTGSFTSNGLEDVYGQCKIVDEKLLGKTKSAFLGQYFVCINRDYGEFVPRKGALEQVMERIKPAVFLLDSAEYKDKLPPLHTIEVRCEMENRGPYEKMKKDFVWQDITAMSAASVIQKLSQGSSGFFYKTEAVAGPTKMISVKTPAWFSSHKFDRLEELLQENQQKTTIIVYNFIEELEELKRRYPHAIGMDDKKAVKKWNSGQVELLLIHPKSAGHGLNLQKGGYNMVFLSLPWSLEMYEQVIGRLLRSGQLSPVWVYILLTKNTIDERIWGSLQNKKSVSELAIEELKQVS